MAGMATLRNMQAKGVKALAWISFGLAICGGAALAGTAPGGWIVSVLGWFPDGVSIFILVIGLGGVAIDVFCDMEPNMVAIWGAVLLPSVAAAVINNQSGPEDMKPQGAKLGTTVSDGSGTILDALNGWSHSWIGGISTITLATTLIALAFVMARRVITKGGHR